MITDPTQTIFIPENTFLDAFTQSELGVWDDCAFKWYLKYGHRLDLVGGFSFPLMYGTALHKSIANFYRGDKEVIEYLEFPEGVVSSLEDEKKLEHWNTVLEATMEAYMEYFQHDLKAFKGTKQELEQVIEVEVEYKGVKIKLKGTLDHTLVGKSDTLIIDSKSFTMMDDGQKEAWRFRFQFMFYVWLAWNSPTFRQKKPARFMVNGVKKTQLRLKKDENLIQFKQRVKIDILTDPGKYFWRDTMEFNQESIDRFEQEHLFPKLDRIVALRVAENVFEDLKPDSFIAINKNTEACFNFNTPCPFLPICSTSFAENEDRYTQRTDKHTNYNEPSSD